MIFKSEREIINYQNYSFVLLYLIINLKKDFLGAYFLGSLNKLPYLARKSSLSLYLSVCQIKSLAFKIFLYFLTLNIRFYSGRKIHAEMKNEIANFAKSLSQVNLFLLKSFDFYCLELERFEFKVSKLSLVEHFRPSEESLPDLTDSVSFKLPLLFLFTGSLCFINSLPNQNRSHSHH
ncbi:hypothetical protein BpHYR1_050283 [Brachionus plicatilis]|uniref:Uncharacterized protein n=1 Tax=Brachionus plicatilis TaxID=10195 RepID=A0A3M7SWQ8_BRAPC|nr:hypothetical protein BpHYR1_050283 [Brachionus plicatilis]